MEDPYVVDGVVVGLSHERQRRSLSCDLLDEYRPSL